MKDYQPTKNNPYTLPRELYRRILYLVRDYDRICFILDCTASNGLQRPDLTDQRAPMGGHADPTARAAMKRIKLIEQVEAVIKALTAIPGEYRQGIVDNIIYGSRFPDIAHLNTWKRHKARFIYEVASNLHEV